MIDLPAKRNLGIVFPSGQSRVSKDEELQRKLEIESKGFAIRYFQPENLSADGFSAGTDVERAVMLCNALTLRTHNSLWVARGGYGSTAIIDYLKTMLPPIIPDKIIVGFSDASFIGNLLSMTYPNLKYVMGAHALEKNLFCNISDNDWNKDVDLTLQILKGETPPPMNIKCQYATLPTFERHKFSEISGTLIPLNLSLAESLACLQSFRLPRAPIFFFEDINEDVYRLLRKIDSLNMAGFFQNAEAIVLGDFSSCPDHAGNEVSLTQLADVVGKRTGLPTLVAPVFGHAHRRLPLMCGSRIEISLDSECAVLHLSFEKNIDRTHQSKTLSDGFLLGNHNQDIAGSRAHFLGIGGTGMAAVAGIAKQAGFRVSGSDGPIYPPMSNVLDKLEIVPIQGYKADNLNKAEPDLVVLANAISRVGANLSANEEFEELLKSRIPVYSFPSFMRKFILNNSLNIVVSGTHGKTTTTSAIAFALRELGSDPTFLIGGSPKNFDLGFHLGRRGIAVLEGDEYDTAMFDKGPKFLHYEPKISLINNIEFDHADIYPNIAAINDEFERLIRLTAANRGIVVANGTDPQVLNLIQKHQDVPIIVFRESNPHSDVSQIENRPTWSYMGHETLRNGSLINLQAPSGLNLQIQTRLFGKHNALNIVGTIAVLHALQLIQEFDAGLDISKLREICLQLPKSSIDRWADALSSYDGVKRRFELLHIDNNIAVFDDFAHHPTAIASTIEAFREYHKVTERTGRLKVCFDPRNATMRRKVLENELAMSLKAADEVYIGKVAVDMRIPENERLDNRGLAQRLIVGGTPAQAFATPEELLASLQSYSSHGDTIVFMSSGSFDGVPARFVDNLQRKNGVTA